jgi:LacI family transcriptional regulator
LQEYGPWSIYLPGSGTANPVRELRGWKGDGVMLRVEDPRVARAAKECGVPVVDLSSAGMLPKAPSVHSDVRAEAAVAFNHLWERGLRNLGYCGEKNYLWATAQYERFKELAQAAGVAVLAYLQPLRLNQSRGWAADRQSLAKWLRGLHKPVGIFACNDIRGHQVLDACRFAGLVVPDDVAVIGVDNDVVRCSLSDPPLSSVAPSTRRAGYLAAELLAQLMAGKRVEPGLRLLQPLGVVARRSTDALVVTDTDVATALRFIRTNANRPIDVKQLLQVVPLSRRALEGRFVRLLGRTPHEEILRYRLERAKQYLCDTDLPIKTVAQRVGVGTPEYLSVLFRRSLGTTPSGYRAQHQPRMATATAEID